MIHELGPRGGALRGGELRCDPENLMESEFFGARRGLHGADADREGFFQAAHGARCSSTRWVICRCRCRSSCCGRSRKEVPPPGDTAETAVDVRILSATHQNLKAMVDAARFRQDLFYRLNVIELRMPALRERSEDIPPLAEVLLARWPRPRQPAGGEAQRRCPPGAQGLRLPGNAGAREQCWSGRWRCAAVRPSAPTTCSSTRATSARPATPRPRRRAAAPLQDYLDRVERHVIEEALEKTGGNRTAAARALGVTFRSLRYRLERLGIKE